MADEPQKIKVDVGLDDIAWLIAAFALFLLCWGDPDLLDVLQEWCRRYMESAP